MKRITANPYVGLVFEKYISDIFAFYNFDVKPKEIAYSNGYDILAVKNNITYIVEVKFSRSRRVSSSILIRAAHELIYLTQSYHNPNIPVLVVGGIVDVDLRKEIEKIGNIIVVDIQNILFLVNNNEILKNNLLSILDFSLNDLTEKKLDTNIFEEIANTTYNEVPEGCMLKKQLCEWSNNNGNSVYENLCYDTLKYLFNDELSLWYKQQTSNSDLYRFDLICKIKDGEVSGIWSTILQCFNSKYIIFEFKNYKDKITQKEIYTTDKYLYLKALRGVAILISCRGASENANKAIRGTLRENGKLILSISNEDLINMIDIKMSNGIPADYLYSKFDQLLIDLEK